MVFFSDFGKTVSDLFKTKDYELKRSVKLKCKSENTEWTTESTFPIAEAENATSKTKYKQTLDKFGAIQLEIPSTKPMKLDYETPNVVDGLKLNLISEAKEVSVEAEYQQGQNAAKFSVTTGLGFSKVGLTAEYAREIKGFWVGADMEYDNEKGVKGYNAGIHYKTSDTQVSCQGNQENLQLQLHSKYSETGELAANWEMDMDKNQLVSVGGKWNIDAKSSVQGFVNSEGNTYCLYKHKISDYCTAHLGSTFQMTNVPDNVNVHYKLEFVA